MLAVILACWTLAGMIIAPLAQELFERVASGVPESGLEAAAHTAGLLRDGAVLVAGLFIFGFASRRFERQADTYAVQLLSTREGRDDATPEAVDAMVAALGTVALLNRVPPARGSWRHGSIAWRQDYLRALAGRAHGALAIDGMVAALRWGALAVVGAGIALGVLPI
jgi:Zn-dependent protease with chaperone function